MAKSNREKLLSKVYAKTHRDFKGVWTTGGPWQGKKTIMLPGPVLALLDDLTDAEILDNLPKKRCEFCNKRETLSLEGDYQLFTDFTDQNVCLDCILEARAAGKTDLIKSKNK